MRVRKQDVVWNYIGTILSMGSNLLLLPALMYFMDSDTLGLWYVFLSVGSLVILIDFGFTPSFARNVAYSWSGATKLSKVGISMSSSNEPNIRLLKKVIKTCKMIYLILSLGALIMMLSIGTVYIIYISKSISGNYFLIAWLIYSISVFLNLYYGYYVTFLRGVGAIKEINISIIVSRVAQIIISIFLLIIGLDIIAVSIAYLAYGLIFRFLAKRFFYNFDNIKDKLRSDEEQISKTDIKDTFDTIWHNAWRDGIVSLSRYLSGQATVIIVSIFFSLSITGIYSISLQLVMALATIGGALYVSLQPSMQAAYVKRDIAKLKKLMSISMTTYTFVFLGGLIALIYIGIPVLNLISSDKSISIPILLAIAIYQFLLKHSAYYASYLSNTNNLMYMRSFILTSAVSIIVAYIIVKLNFWGIYGLIIGQGICHLAYNNWKWPNVVLRSLNINIFNIYSIGIISIYRIISKKENF